MKGTLFAAFAIALLFASPAMAEELGASANADARLATSADLSPLNLRFRSIGEAFSDFVFNVRSALTFDHNAKVDLLMERNAELKARQQAWLELKAEAMEQFGSGTLTEEQKKEIEAFLKAEHSAIIKEHIRTTGDIKEIQLAAKAGGNHELETNAESSADECEKSGLSLGLNVPVNDEAGLSIGTETGAEASMTTEEARAMVEAQLDLKATGVRTESKNGEIVYVISGAETEASGDYSLEKSYEVIVEADTRVITSVELDLDIISISAGEEAQGSGKIGIVADIGNEAESEDSESQGPSAEASAKAESKSSARIGSTESSGQIAVGIGG